MFLVGWAARVAKSATLRGGDEPASLAVDLNGAVEFTLRATDAGDGPWADHADWGEAKVTLADGRTLWLDESETRTTDMIAKPASGDAEPAAEIPWATELKAGARREAWTLVTDDHCDRRRRRSSLCVFELSSRPRVGTGPKLLRPSRSWSKRRWRASGIARTGFSGRNPRSERRDQGDPPLHEPRPALD